MQCERARMLADLYPVEVCDPWFQRANGCSVDDWGIVGGTTADCTICTAIQIDVCIDDAGDKVIQTSLRLQKHNTRHLKHSHSHCRHYLKWRKSFIKSGHETLNTHCCATKVQRRLDVACACMCTCMYSSAMVCHECHCMLKGIPYSISHLRSYN